MQRVIFNYLQIIYRKKVVKKKLSKVFFYIIAVNIIITSSQKASVFLKKNSHFNEKEKLYMSRFLVRFRCFRRLFLDYFAWCLLVCVFVIRWGSGSWPGTTPSIWRFRHRPGTATWSSFGWCSTRLCSRDPDRSRSLVSPFITVSKVTARSRTTSRSWSPFGPGTTRPWSRPIAVTPAARTAAFLAMRSRIILALCFGARTRSPFGYGSAFTLPTTVWPRMKASGSRLPFRSRRRTRFWSRSRPPAAASWTRTTASLTARSGRTADSCLRNWSSSRSWNGSARWFSTSRSILTHFGFPSLWVSVYQMREIFIILTIV